MKPTAMQMRKALEERLRALKVQVPVSVLREGDLVEYLDLSGGWRGGRVVRIQPRAGRVVVGAYAKEDLPRGHKDLARYVSKKRRLVLAAQLVGVLAKEDGRHVSVRPGTDAWITFTAARAAGRESGRPKATAEGPHGNAPEREPAGTPAMSAAKPAARHPPGKHRCDDADGTWMPDHDPDDVGKGGED